MSTARDVARATKDALAADGIYITQTNGSAAGQSVFHYHMHIYPKWSDGRRLDHGDDERKRTMEKVRAAMQGQA
jgi:histidine triad (HIT) family protein